MRSIKLTVLVFVIGFFGFLTSVQAQTAAAPMKPAADKVTDADYTDWLFVKSDKSLQFRFAIASRPGILLTCRCSFG
jgi:hypothetical protein